MYFNWRLISLQYCSGFCHTLTWISHEYTCVPPVPNPPPTSPHPIPQGHPIALALRALSRASDLHWSSISHGNIHVSMLFSQIILPSPSPTESKSLFFTSVSLLLSHIQSHRYHLSKFHIYALIYRIGVFRSDFTLYNRLQFHPPHWNWFKRVLFNSWVVFHCAYVPRLSYPFVCPWTSRLFPCPSYCK